MFVFDTINTCVNIAYDFCVGAYLQLQWIANMQRQSDYMLDCFVEVEV